MGRDERVVVAGEQEQVAVLHVDVGLFDIDGQGGVDEGEISDQYLILKIEGP